MSKLITVPVLAVMIAAFVALGRSIFQDLEATQVWVITHFDTPLLPTAFPLMVALVAAVLFTAALFVKHEGWKEVDLVFGIVLAAVAGLIFFSQDSGEMILSVITRGHYEWGLAGLCAICASTLTILLVRELFIPRGNLKKAKAA